jgi:F-type H+-transporting ATPase subunit b
VAIKPLRGGWGVINLNFTLVLQVLNFLLLVFVLYKLLYKPVMKFLDERAHRIRTLIDETERAKEEAEKNAAKAQEKVQKARQDAYEILEKAKLEAQLEREKILEDTRLETQRMIRRAKEEIEHDVERAKGELRREVSGLSLMIAERLIEKSLTTEDNKRLVKKYLDELEKFH